MVWSTSALIAAYTMTWLIYLVDGLVAGTQTALTPYITSTFASHSLTPFISILSYSISGVPLHHRQDPGCLWQTSRLLTLHHPRFSGFSDDGVV
jgi:hypothetical protein